MPVASASARPLRRSTFLARLTAVPWRRHGRREEEERRIDAELDIEVQVPTHWLLRARAVRSSASPLSRARCRRGSSPSARAPAAAEPVYEASSFTEHAGGVRPAQARIHLRSHQCIAHTSRMAGVARQGQSLIGVSPRDHAHGRQSCHRGLSEERPPSGGQRHARW